jgi:hypothetical protein
MNAPVRVPIGQIVIDDNFQPRYDGLAEEHVRSLMETPESWPPVVLARCSTGLYLIDGFHRHDAACRLGMSELTATIFDPPENADLFATAFALNAKHGRALTLRDRKAYGLMLLQQYPGASDRDLGAKCGLNHETVGKLRRAQSAAVPIAERKPGELPGDVGLFDPIRFRKSATKDQKAIAGYIARLAIAMDDPYDEDSTIEIWPDDPEEIARACVLAMGGKRAAPMLESLEADALFILDITEAAKPLLKEVS